METTFLLKIVKEVYVNLKDINEAEQIADMISNRESEMTTLGNLTSVYTEVEQLQLN